MPIGSETFGVLTRVVASPSGESIDALDLSQLAQLIDLAADHRVTGSVVQALRDAGRDLPRPLERANNAVTTNHLRSLGALERAGRALDGAGIRWIVVKGPALAARWALGATARGYHDLDLLVDPGSLHKAVETLRAAGFEHRNRNWEGFRERGVGEVPLDDGAVVIDLHWHLLGLAEQRRAVHLPTSQMLDRSVPIQLGRVSARTLDDADTLVHLGVHHAFAGARYLVQLMDLHLMAREVDRDVVLSRLHAAGATRLVGTALDRAERLFGPVGLDFVAAEIVRDPVWLGLNRAVDRAWALTRPGASTPFPGALIATGRADRGATARAIAASVVSSLRSRVGATTVVSKGGPLDWEVDAGGRVAYEQFLDEVSSGTYGR